MHNPKEKIKELIAASKLKDALQLCFEQIAANDAENRNAMINLKRRFNENQQSFHDETISDNDYRVEKARINQSLLAFVEEFWQAENQANARHLSPLQTAIGAIPLSIDAKLGVLQLVNSNRSRAFRQYKKLSSQKNDAKQPFQFYFLSGCPDEMPSSLAERILYELMHEKQDATVLYPFMEGDFKRVRIENLPLSTADVGASKKKFKEYVHKRFAFSNTESFEKFIESGLPKLNYDIVATVFKLSETDWEDDEGELTVYLKWMMDTFKTTHPDVPTFIFLFVLQFRNLHDPTKVKPRNLEIVAQLEAFCAEHQTAVFRELTPINDTHLEDWFYKLDIDSTVPLPRLIAPIIAAFTNTLPPQDCLIIDGQPHFHMKDAESLQYQVVHHFRDKK